MQRRDEPIDFCLSDERSRTNFDDLKLAFLNELVGLRRPDPNAF